MANNAPNQIVTQNLVNQLEDFLRYTESTAPLSKFILNMLLVYSEQNGSIFGQTPEQINDMMFLIKFLDDCDKLKATA